MSCSSIDEDCTPYGLPPIPIHEKTETWNGREVQVLDPSCSISGDYIPTPAIPDQKAASTFYQRHFEDLTHADPAEEELLCPESDWILAQAMTFIESNCNEDLTVEELLAIRGLMFDREFGKQVICKSIWKRLEHAGRKIKHEVGKGVKKTAKKTKEVAKKTVRVVKKAAKDTVEFVKDIPKHVCHETKKICHYVKEHPIKSAVYVIAAIVLTIIIVELWPYLVTAGLLKAADNLANKPRSRSREEDGPDPDEPGPWPELPDLQALDQLPSKSAFGTYLENEQRRAIDPSYQPPLNPYHPIFSQRNNTPAEKPPESSAANAEQIVPVMPPSSQPATNAPNILANIFNKIRQSLEIIGRDGSEPEQPVSNAPNAGPAESSTPTIPSPDNATPANKSPYGIYLENQQRKAIDPTYQPPFDPSQGIDAAQNSNAPASAPSADATKNALANVLETLRRGLETIGRGMSDTELLQPNSPLDLFNKDYTDQQKSETAAAENSGSNAGASAANAGPNISEMLKKVFGALGQAMGNTEAVGEQQEGGNIFKIVAETIQKGLETIGRGMCDSELLDPNSPLDLFNKDDAAQIPASSIPIDTKSKFDQLVLESTIYGLLEMHESGNLTTPRPWEMNSLFNNNYHSRTPQSDAPTKSCHFETQGTKMAGIGVGFIPGMNTSYEEAISHANHIKKFAGGIDIRIEGVYNHSNGKIFDMGEIFALNYFGIAPNTADLLIENWTRFFKENEHNPDAKYLQFGHSMGSIIIYAALLRAPEEIRDRIMVVTLGTAKVVPEELCFRSNPYASKSDYVHYGEDLFQQLLASFSDEEDRASILSSLSEKKNKLILLEPHPDAPSFDHGFQSPTNDPVFEDFVKTHLRNNGEYK